MAESSDSNSCQIDPPTRKDGAAFGRLEVSRGHPGDPLKAFQEVAKIYGYTIFGGSPLIVRLGLGMASRIRDLFLVLRIPPPRKIREPLAEPPFLRNETHPIGARSDKDDKAQVRLRKPRLTLSIAS